MSHRRLILALVTVLTFASIAPAALAEEATALSGTPVTATLPGNPWAGAYDLYQIAYPGGRVPIYIRFYSLSTDVITNETLDFTLYRPYAGPQKGDKKADGAYQEISYANDDPATLTVQIANYSRKAVTYQLEVLGLPESESTASVLTPVPEQPTAPAAAQLDEVPADAPTTLEGTLVGNRAGNFAEYRFTATAGEQISFTFTYQPIDPSYGNAVNFRVYDPNGKLAAKGVEFEPRVWKDTFVVKQSGEYTLQVQNYAQDVPLNYTLTIER
ncbi:MAG: hypothetical protein ABFD20_07870 [Anaerolineales bacterium]